MQTFYNVNYALKEVWRYKREVIRSRQSKDSQYNGPKEKGQKDKQLTTKTQNKHTIHKTK